MTRPQSLGLVLGVAALAWLAAPWIELKALRAHPGVLNAARLRDAYPGWHAEEVDDLAWAAGDRHYYRQLFPQGRHAEEAAWDLALGDPTLAQMEAYLKAFPSGRHDTLEEAWKVVDKTRLEPVRAYRRLFVGGPHGEEAEALELQLAGGIKPVPGGLGKAQSELARKYYTRKLGEGTVIAPSVLVLLVDDAVAHGGVLKAWPDDLAGVIGKSFAPFKVRVQKVGFPQQAHFVLEHHELRVQLPGGPKLATRRVTSLDELREVFRFR